MERGSLRTRLPLKARSDASPSDTAAVPGEDGDNGVQNRT